VVNGGGGKIVKRKGKCKKESNEKRRKSKRRGRQRRVIRFSQQKGRQDRDPQLSEAAFGKGVLGGIVSNSGVTKEKYTRGLIKIEW